MRREQSHFGEFLKYTCFNVLGMIGLSCYILADTFFISKGLGADGLTALNLAIPMYSFINGSGMMLGMGSATKYSIYQGQGRHREGNRAFTWAVCMAGFFALIFVLLGLFGAGKLTALLGADAAVYEMTRTYLRTLLLFAPAFILNGILLCFVRNDGNPGLAMTAMLTGNFCNIVLDYVFIFPMGMGIFGAIFATGLAPVISICVLSVHKITGKNHFHFCRIMPELTLPRGILALGVPSLITELASGIVIVAFNFMILGIRGNTGVAAYGVVANLSLVVTAVFNGIAQGMQPLTSRAYGKGEWKVVREIFRYAVGALLAAAVVIYGVIFFLASPITDVFNSERNMELQRIAEEGLRIYFTAAPFVGFNVVAAMFFSSTDRALPAQVISLLRGFFVILPAAFLLSALFGMRGVWMAYPVAEVIVAALAGVMFWIYARRRVGQGDT